MQMPARPGKVRCKLLYGQWASCKPPFRMLGMHSHFQTPFTLRTTNLTLWYRALRVCSAADSEGKQGWRRRLADPVSACGRCDGSLSCAPDPEKGQILPFAQTRVLETWMQAQNRLKVS